MGFRKMSKAVIESVQRRGLSAVIAPMSHDMRGSLTVCEPSKNRYSKLFRYVKIKSLL